jgi:hypothetical protein
VRCRPSSIGALSESNAARGIVAEKLALANVLADHALGAVAGLAMMSRSSMPAHAAAAARPARRLWLAYARGSRPAARARCLTTQRHHLTAYGHAAMSADNAYAMIVNKSDRFMFACVNNFSTINT